MVWAPEGVRDPDPWAGLTEFMVRAVGSMAADRGLQEVMSSHDYGHDRVARVRERIIASVDTLVSRCQQAGLPRTDVTGADLGLVHVMLSALVEYTEPVERGLWRRHLVLFIDRLRTPVSPSPRAAPTEDTTRQTPPRLPEFPHSS